MSDFEDIDINLQLNNQQQPSKNQQPNYEGFNLFQPDSKTAQKKERFKKIIREKDRPEKDDAEDKGISKRFISVKNYTDQAASPQKSHKEYPQKSHKE